MGGEWEWVEYMGVVSRRQMWVESIENTLGIVVERYIDLLILLISTLLVSALFCTSYPYFLITL